jgi:hypothetical protein
MGKVKLTLTVDKSVLEEGRRAAEQRNTSISRLVENFLAFIANPVLYCFGCGKSFKVKMGQSCPKCGWVKCPKCGSCRCSLTEEAAVVAYHLRQSIEDLTSGRVS